MILAGDVGGTKVNLGLFQVEKGVPQPVIGRSYASRDYPDLIPLIESFLQETQLKVSQACLGVAGPVHDGRCILTHLPWTVDVCDLKTLLQTESVFLINDLAALAYGVPHLSSGEVGRLQEGKADPRGVIAVLAAGTGLGQAFLIPDGQGRWRALETEGGQCDFAPRTDVEVLLHESIRKQSGRVAVEDVLSGPGLIRLYDFFKQREGRTGPEDGEAGLKKEDQAWGILQRGLSEPSGPCRKALETFVSVYGAVAGNLALQAVARGGVYLGGGIAPELMPLLKSELFLEPFRDKGEFRKLLTQIPVQVVLNKRAPLLGAAYFALGETGIQ